MYEEPIRKLFREEYEKFRYGRRPLVLALPFLPSLYRNIINIQGRTGRRQGVKNYLTALAGWRGIILYAVLFGEEMAGVFYAVTVVYTILTVIALYTTSMRRLKDIRTVSWLMKVSSNLAPTGAWFDFGGLFQFLAAFNPLRFVGYTLAKASDEDIETSFVALEREKERMGEELNDYYREKLCRS